MLSEFTPTLVPHASLESTIPIHHFGLSLFFSTVALFFRACKTEIGTRKGLIYMPHDNKPILPNIEQGNKLESHTPNQQILTENPGEPGTKFESKCRTDKQRQASSVNGRKSHGPISQAGKQKAAQNSVRDGICSRTVVIEALGETREAFDRFRRAHFDSLQPCGPLEEQFVSDFTENCFLRERVRRAEELERRNRLDTFQLENELKRADQLDKFRDRFLVEFENYVATSDFTFRRLPHALDEARRDLMSISEGIDFLLLLLAEVEVCFREDGTLIANHRALFQAIRGCGHPLDIRNWIEHLATDNDSAPPWTGEPEFESDYAEREELSHGTNDSTKRDKLPFNTSSDAVTAGFTAFISSVAESLRDRKKKLEKIEAGEIQKEIALIMLDPSPSERFSRAETSRERKMYRALGGLSALRAMAPSSPLPVAANVNSESEVPTGAPCSKIAKRTREFRMSEPARGVIQPPTIVLDLTAPHPEVTSNGPPPS